jgi:hypothetical protein
MVLKHFMDSQNIITRSLAACNYFTVSRSCSSATQWKYLLWGPFWGNNLNMLIKVSPEDLNSQCRLIGHARCVLDVLSIAPLLDHLSNEHPVKHAVVLVCKESEVDKVITAQPSQHTASIDRMAGYYWENFALQAKEQRRQRIAGHC